jgi:phage tail tape-measure protein
MEQKKTIMIGMTVGSILGGALPGLWDASMFSVSGVIFTAIGGFVGIWAGYKFSE